MVEVEILDLESHKGGVMVTWKTSKTGIVNRYVHHRTHFNTVDEKVILNELNSIAEEMYDVELVDVSGLKRLKGCKLVKKDGIVQVINSSSKIDEIALLEGLKWIGPELAGALVDKFGDLGGVLNASRESLIGVMGVGAGNVDKIIEQLKILRG